MMNYSTQCRFLAEKYGYVKAVRMLIDAGYPCIDISAYLLYSDIYTDNYKALARELLSLANDNGVRFNQAHAPYRGNYKRDIIPRLPRVSILWGPSELKP
jgi:hypothetical protein